MQHVQKMVIKNIHVLCVETLIKKQLRDSVMIISYLIKRKQLVMKMVIKNILVQDARILIKLTLQNLVMITH